MADPSLKHHLRGQILRQGGPGMLSAVARHRGFPSPEALEASLALGSRLHLGGHVTAADVASLARHYPAIPQHVIHAYAVRINGAEGGTARRDAFVRQMGFGHALDAAAQEIERYGVLEVAGALAARREERARPEPGFPPRDAKAHPFRQHNDDKAERRALLERSIAGPTEFRPDSGYREVRHQLADRMEENAGRFHAAESAGENRRIDDVAYAYDRVHADEQADALIGAEDLIQPLAETQAGENPA